MDIICKVQIPTVLVSDMSSTETKFEKDVMFKQVPFIGMKLRENTLRKAMCHNENSPLVIEDLIFCMETGNYIAKTNMIWIDSNYTGRVNDWDSNFLESIREITADQLDS